MRALRHNGVTAVCLRAEMVAGNARQQVERGAHDPACLSYTLRKLMIGSCGMTGLASAVAPHGANSTTGLFPATVRPSFRWCAATLGNGSGALS
jgi:hypothetical protein